ncbi:AAA family ATPase [Actinoplanes bogorensis]|uniref:AAA family ATPase n=1 Tax=Paractinoplanes bogorensis TaxID=1610840 RepID=A0ABS5Z630_9ACTN|nr:AAA family ATPase [Actinoplanes bogorensis]MBU2670398.1 AAA family ATPase [Actinoplanes bogorensis]
MPAGLRVYLLGGFQVEVAGRTVPDGEWQRTGAIALVKLLAVHGRLHRDQVIDLLWPDAAPGLGQGRLNKSLHFARRVLGADRLRSHDDMLDLDPAGRWTDADAFEAAARRGDVEAAIALYGGDLLPENRFDDWVDQRRVHLRDVAVGLLLTRATRTDLERAILLDPLHESAHIQLIRLDADEGHRHRALRRYEQFAAHVRAELGIEPSAELRRLHASLISSAPDGAPTEHSTVMDGPPSGTLGELGESRRPVHQDERVRNAQLRDEQPSEDRPGEKRPHDDRVRHERPRKERPREERPREERPREERPRDRRPHDRPQHADRPRSEQPNDQRLRDELPSGEQTRDHRPHDRRQHADRPRSERPDDERTRHEGTRDEPVREERKLVTVLDVDLRGVRGAAVDPDPERARREIGEWTAAISEVVVRWGGAVRPLLGGGVIGVFGYPVAREDHAARALWAGHEILERVGSPVRMGVATGEIIAPSGGLGASRIGTLSDSVVQRIGGVVLDAAADLRAAADAGSLLADDRTGQAAVRYGDFRFRAADDPTGHDSERAVMSERRLQPSGPADGKRSNKHPPPADDQQTADGKPATELQLPTPRGERTTDSKRAAELQLPTPRGERTADSERAAGLRLPGARGDRAAVWRLVGASLGVGEAGAEPPMVGRAEELRAVLSLVDEAAGSRRPRLITVTGPAGIGKTRLVHEVVARRPGLRVLRGRCLAAGEGITYWALGEILREACGIPLGDSGESGRLRLTEQLTPLLGEATVFALATTAGIRLPGNPLDSADPRDVDDALGRAWPRLASAFAAKGPLLLIVEDLHWAGAPLIAMLTRLVNRAEGPVVVLTTARPEFFEERTPRGDLGQRHGRIRPDDQRQGEPDHQRHGEPDHQRHGEPDHQRHGEPDHQRQGQSHDQRHGEPDHQRRGEPDDQRQGREEEEAPEEARDRGDERERPTLRDADIVSLRALNVEDGRALLDGLPGASRLDGRRRTQILDRADGNPYYLGQLAAHVAEGGHGALPDTLHALLAERVDRLPTAEKVLLRRAAVIGRTFWAAPLRATAGQLRALEDRGLIRVRPMSGVTDQDEYAFQHALLRDVAYAGLPVAERAAGHAGAAAWLEEVSRERIDEVVELVAVHYAAAADGPDADDWVRGKAFRSLIAAGVGARRRYAVRRALELHQRARRFAAGPAERAEALEAIGDDHETAYAGDDAIAAWREAITALPKGDRRAQLCLKTAQMLVGRWGGFRTPADPALGDRVLDEGLAAVTDPATKAHLLALRALCGARWAWTGRADPAPVAERRRAADEACALAGRVGSASLRGLALVGVSAALFLEERYAEAVDTVLALVELEGRDRDRALGHTIASLVIGGVRGDYELALEHARRSYEWARTLSPHDRLHGTAAVLICLEQLGRVDEIDPYLEEHLALRRGPEASMACPYIRSGPLVGALALARRGEPDRAIEVAATVAIDLTHPGNAEVLRGRLALAAGDVATARELAERLVRMNRRPGPEEIPHEALLLVEALEAAGDRAALRGFLPRARKAAGYLAILGPACDRAEKAGTPRR